MMVDTLISELESARKSQNLSMRKFAKQLGITHGYYSLLAAGKHPPGRKVLEGCSRLGLTAAILASLQTDRRELGVIETSLD